MAGQHHPHPWSRSTVTSALVAALIEDHEFHRIAQSPHIRVIGAFGSELLAPWSSAKLLIPTSSATAATVLAKSIELDLGGNIHDALIALACKDASVPQATLDGRQHRVALALGVQSTYLAV